MKKMIIIFLSTIILLTACTDKKADDDENTTKVETTAAKPVIYLYPEQMVEVNVLLDYDGELLCTYPEYKDGWKVTAYPDGRLIDLDDHAEYSYLFWEGTSDHDWDLSSGFVIKGDESAEFLREKLAFMGLTPKEYNEFIVYWLPRMINNPYNLVYFASEDYTEHAKLTIDPKPDSMLRIFMVFKGLDEPIEIQAQQLIEFTREGFTVIEWGGTEIK